MGRSKHSGVQKRSRDEFEESNIGLGHTLSLIRNPETAGANSSDGDDTNIREKSKGHANSEPHLNKKQKKIPQKGDNNYPEIKHSAQARLNTHVRISDLQNLVLYIVANGPAPQWCSIRHHHAIRKVVVLMVPGLEAGMFDGRIEVTAEPEHDATSEAIEKSTMAENELKESGVSTDLPSAEPDCQPSHVLPARRDKLSLSPDDYYPTKLSADALPEPLKPLAEIFTHLWPIKCPGDDRYNRVHSPIHAMLHSPLTEKKDKKSKGPAPAKQSKDWRDQKTTVSVFVATVDQLEENDYVLHPACFADNSAQEESLNKRRTLSQASEDGWVDTAVVTLADGDVPNTEIPKGSLTGGREILAIDCEMCKTSPETFSLTRISVVGWTGQIIMDELVKPAEPIIDYLTPYSGITEEMLTPVTTTLQDIQEKLLSLITPKTILVGHSLDGDLKALKLTHPFIVDTALLYPHPRGPPLKSSLKWLCQRYLGREIQKGHGATGHNSVEDARACLDLVRMKCEKGPKWGTAEASSESIFKRVGRSPKPSFVKVNPVAEEMRSGAVVDWGDPRKGPGSNAELLIGCQDDTAVVEGIKRAVTAENGGADFVWARMRGLELQRGWFNDKSTLSVTSTVADEQKDASDSNTAAKNEQSATEISDSPAKISTKPLSEALKDTVSNIYNIWKELPACTVFIVYSGNGDPRELTRLQALHTQFKNEYKVKKWDQLTVKWTDEEEQATKKAAKDARLGIGFICVK